MWGSLVLNAQCVCRSTIDVLLSSVIRISFQKYSHIKGHTCNEAHQRNRPWGRGDTPYSHLWDCHYTSRLYSPLQILVLIMSTPTTQMLRNAVDSLGMTMWRLFGLQQLSYQVHTFYVPTSSVLGMALWIVLFHLESCGFWLYCIK